MLPERGKASQVSGAFSIGKREVPPSLKEDPGRRPSFAAGLARRDCLSLVIGAGGLRASIPGGNSRQEPGVRSGHWRRHPRFHATRDLWPHPVQRRLSDSCTAPRPEEPWRSPSIACAECFPSHSRLTSSSPNIFQSRPTSFRNSLTRLARNHNQDR